MKNPDNVLKGMSDVFYGKVDPRRRQERKDSRMVQEDQSCFANLSDKFIHREFNQHKYVEHFADDIYEIYDDTRDNEGR